MQKNVNLGSLLAFAALVTNDRHAELRTSDFPANRTELVFLLNVWLVLNQKMW